MQGRVFLGRYETIRQIGEGGMGRVYLAKQTDLGRQVVVKVMHDHVASDPTFRERFARETLLMARFQHPYAVTLYDASLNDPQGPCIVMEYIRGITLDEVLRKNSRLSPGRVGRILGQLCEVLQAAHTEGIIHRDLKPSNLMIVDADSPYEMLKVMDFGLAKLITKESNHGAVVSNAEFAVGTPGYMCPEQARGEEMDNRGDLYSVGVILYELLTGRLPFAGRSTMDLLLAHATEEPPPFACLGNGIHVPSAIEEVVHLCLAKDPNARPATARDLAEHYERALLETSVLVDPPQPRARSASVIMHGRRVIHAHGLPQRLPSVPIANSPPSSMPQMPLSRSVPIAISPSKQGVISPSKQVRSRRLRHRPRIRLRRRPPSVNDPLAVVQTLEAWMPETIAKYKLCGFIDDVGGELIENVPGRIKVRLGGKRCLYKRPGPAQFLFVAGHRRPRGIHRHGTTPQSARSESRELSARHGYSSLLDGGRQPPTEPGGRCAGKSSAIYAAT